VKKQEVTSRKGLYDTRSYCRTKMQKDIILEKIKEKGFRLTSQREILINIILENECASCKEIYYKASKVDEQIGIATVYRMINILEEIGAINRKNLYKIMYSDNCMMQDACTIILEDDTTFHLSAQIWNEVVKAGLNAHGYLSEKNIKSIAVKGCECGE